MRHLLLPLLLVGALAAGCGSSGRLSHGKLLEQADAICAKAHAADAKLPAPHVDADVVPHLSRLIAIAQNEHAELAALKPGKDDAKPYAELLARLEKTIQLTTRVRAAAKAKQTLRAKVLIAEVVRSNKDAQSFAAGFGLTVCSKSAS
jgi:hypothetical protein